MATTVAPLPSATANHEGADQRWCKQVLHFKPFSFAIDQQFVADCSAMRIAVQTPADFDRGPVFVEAILKSLHRANPQRLPVTLEIGPVGDSVGLIAEVPNELKAIFMAQLADACPGVKVVVLPESSTPDVATRCWCRQLRLTPDVCALSTHAFEDSLDRVRADPMTSVLSALRTTQRRRIIAQTRLTIRPATKPRYRQALQIRENLDRRFRSRRIEEAYRRFCTAERLMHRLFAVFLLKFPRHRSSRHSGRISEFTTGKLDGLLFESWLHIEVSAPPDARHQAEQRLREIAGAFGQFASAQTTFEPTRLRAHIATRKVSRRGFLLSPEEVSALWHLPKGDVHAARTDRAAFSELEPPVDLPSPSVNNSVTGLGKVQFRQQNDHFGLLPDDRRRHVFICGKTGMGKSTLLLRMLASDMAAGHGAGLIDPHGDLVEAALSVVPKRRTNDVCLFDAAEQSRPVTFNPLAVPAGSDPVLVAESVLSVFENVFGLSESASPRLLHILRNSLLSLVDVPDATLLSINRLLLEDGYRRTVTGRTSNPVVQQFWFDEFARWKPADRTQFIASLQNKLGAFLTNPQLQRILGNPNGTIDLRRMMDRGQILLVNLSKGRLGESPSRLLGSLLVSSLQTAAMSRADIPEHERRDFLVSIDEFQNFSTESFATQLSESRKYRVSLTLANQYLDQIDPTTLAAVFGNVGSLLSFQVGPTDAETLAVQFGGRVTPETLMNLPRYHACTRLLIDGHPARPFLMTTLQPPKHDPAANQRIKRVSQSRFGSRIDNAQ